MPSELYLVAVRSAIFSKPYTGYVNTDFLCLGAPAVHTSVLRLHTFSWLLSQDADFFEAPGGGKSLSLIQMVLLRHLTAGFGEEGCVE